jgi:hypothetical protein
LTEKEDLILATREKLVRRPESAAVNGCEDLTRVRVMPALQVPEVKLVGERSKQAEEKWLLTIAMPSDGHYALQQVKYSVLKISQIS